MPKMFIPLLVLSIIVCCIEIDVSVPGFPAMAKFFNVSDSTISLTVALNAFGFSLAAVFYGPLSDSFGRRKLMLAGNFLMMIGSVLCVFAPSIELLLITRFIQGLGASTSAVIVFAMVAESYPPEKSTGLIGLMNAILTAAMAIAPVIGGLINTQIGWRGNYGFIALISIISWVLLILYLPETKKNFEKLSVKKIIKDYKTLLLSKEFMIKSAIPSLLCSCYCCFASFSSFIYIDGFNLSVFEYSLHQAFITATFSLVSMGIGKLVAKIGSIKATYLGFLIAFIGIQLLLILSYIGETKYLTTLCFAIYGIGFPIVYPIIFAESLEIFPDIKGTASSAIMSIRALFVFSVVYIAGLFFDGTLKSLTFVLYGVVILTIVLFCLNNKKYVSLNS